MLIQFFAALNQRLRDDKVVVLKRAWSIRIALFWGAVSGLLAAWPAFAGQIPLWAYATGSVVITSAITIARVTKQEGIE